MTRSPLRFFLLVFVLSVPFWLLGAATEHRSTGLPLNIPISAQMACCPLLAAVVLRHRQGGSAAARHVVSSAFDYRCIDRRRWYGPAVLLMPVVMLVSYGVMRLTGRPLPDPRIPWLALPLGTVARRVLIGWLYNNTGRSVLAAVLMHSMDNVGVFAFPNYGSHYDPMVTGLVVIVVALLVTSCWGPGTLARHRFRSVDRTVRPRPEE